MGHCYSWWPLLTPHPGTNKGQRGGGDMLGHLVITRNHWNTVIIIVIIINTVIICSGHRDEWPLGEINWGRTEGVMIKYKYSNTVLASVSGTRLVLWSHWWSNNWKVRSSDGHLVICNRAQVLLQTTRCWKLAERYYPPPLIIRTPYRFL